MAISLTVTDPAGANARHAIGVHIVPIRDDGKIPLGLRAKSLRLAGSYWSTTGVRAGSGDRSDRPAWTERHRSSSSS